MQLKSPDKPHEKTILQQSPNALQNPNLLTANSIVGHGHGNHATTSTQSSNFYENTMHSDTSSAKKRKSVISSQSTGSSNEVRLVHTFVGRRLTNKFILSRLLFLSRNNFRSIHVITTQRALTSSKLLEPWATARSTPMSFRTLKNIMLVNHGTSTKLISSIACRRFMLRLRIRLAAT